MLSEMFKWKFLFFIVIYIEVNIAKYLLQESNKIQQTSYNDCFMACVCHTFVVEGTAVK